MPAGVFGKLPDKRDFVQNGMSPELMGVLDPWLQGAVAQSRDTLGNSWLDIYLTAPIWRFWLGSDLLGSSVIGALMPSVDGVGRYFPLCIAEVTDPSVPPPEINDQDGWFTSVEMLLLNALSDGGTYDALQAGLVNLPIPSGARNAPPAGDGVSGVFARLRQHQIDPFYGPFTYWWVPPSKSGTVPARVMMSRGMPPTSDFATMLSSDRGHELSATVGGA